MAIIGLGTDICSVARIRQVWSRHGSLCDRICTPEEVTYVGQSAERLAARFAAKEAGLKALGTGIGPLSWHDLVIDRDQAGRPVLRLSERATEIAHNLGAGTWHVSLSHERDYATAVVILEG
ncbi:holo-ACP synthase [Peptococcus simiae]|uniref:holo-ACP synthase n=1 Tax=Peptococcus simiae TaxID=1643805 RepID=UPI003980A3D4